MATCVRTIIGVLGMAGLAVVAAILHGSALPMVSAGCSTGQPGSVLLRQSSDIRWKLAAFENQSVGVIEQSPTDPTTIYVAATVLNRSTDGGVTFQPLNQAFRERVSGIAIHPQNPKIIYVSASFGVYKTIDDGETWEPLMNGIPSGGPVADIVMDPRNPDTLYAFQNDGLFKTQDAGQSWALILPSGTNNGRLIIDPLNSKTLYYLSEYYASREVILRSDNSGVSWQVITRGLEERRAIFDLIQDPKDPNILYAGTDDGVYKTTNRGDLWVPSNKGIEFVDVYSLGYDQVGKTDLYAGGAASSGCWVSRDNGQSWESIKDGLPGRFVISILVVPEVNTIFAGTTVGLYARKLVFDQPDTLPPTVQVTAPNGNDVIRPNSRFPINWTSTDDFGVTRQEIALSTDSGATFSISVASGLSPDADRFIWSVPADLITTQARIRVAAVDAAGNIGTDDSDGDFGVFVSRVRLSGGPNSQIIKAGGRASYKIFIEREYFTELVTLAVADLPSGVTAMFSEVSTRGSEVDLTLNANDITQLGTYQITIQGTATGVDISPTSVLLTVSKDGDFVLSLASSAPQVLAPGDSVNTQLSVQAVEGFTETVHLKAMVTPARGVDVRFSPAELKAGQSTTVTIISEAGVIPNVYVISIIGETTMTTRQMTVIAKVGTGGTPDFSFILNPTSQSILSGGTVSFTALVEPIGEFVDDVQLEALVSPPDPNIVAQIAPGSVKPKNSAVVVIATQNGLRSGTYTVVLVGKSNNVTNTGTVTVNVQSPEYSLSFAQPELTIQEGSKGTIEVKVNRTGGYGGVVTVTPDLAKVKALKMKLTPATGTTAGGSVTFTFKMKKNPPVGRHTLTFVGQDDRGLPPRVQTLTVVIK